MRAVSPTQLVFSGELGSEAGTGARVGDGRLGRQLEFLEFGTVSTLSTL